MSEVQDASKVNTNCTYAANANYWALLSNEDEDEDALQASVNNINAAQAQRDLRSMLTAWLYQRIGKHQPFNRRASTMVVVSGATSSFVRLEENLPITGPSNNITNTLKALPVKMAALGG